MIANASASRPRRLVVAAAVMVAASACGASAPPAWTRLPGGPLSARHGAHAFWTGTSVIVVGGADTAPCPPNASCVAPNRPPLRDGAAYEPATARWRAIAPAPVPLGHGSGAMLGERLYMWTPGSPEPAGVPAAFLVYDSRADRWAELPKPPGDDTGGLRLLAAGDVLVAFHPTQENAPGPDRVYDPRSRTWSTLPQDPLAPSFDRDMVWTGRHLVVLGLKVVPNPGSEGPSLYRAARLDLDTGRWTRLPDSKVAFWDPSWFWSGGTVINPSLGATGGGEGDPGGRPYPRGGMLDPATGDWAPLPNPPTKRGDYVGLALANSDSVVSRDGWVLHVPTRRWTRLHRPDPAGPARFVGLPGSGESAGEAEAVVWAGDRLLVWGGVRWDGNESTILDDGWIWEPPWAREKR